MGGCLRLQNLASFSFVLIASFVAAFSALCATSALAWRRFEFRDDATRDTGAPAPAPVDFLFQNDEIRDVSDAGADLLEHVDYETSDWQRVRDLLAPRFRDVPASLPRDLDVTLPALDPADRARARIIARGGTTRVHISEAEPFSAADRHLRRLAEARLHQQEAAVAHAPFPVWATDAGHRLLWSNGAYCRIAGDGILSTGLPLPRDTTPVTARVQLERPGAEEGRRWLDVTVQRDGDVWLYYAADVSPVIRAEIAQRDFVQTLTKTFALLSSGLAIFDRDRKLSLFNPAVIDLTGLEPEFLSARPSLSAVFGALREKRVMPEPSSFQSWRHAMADLNARAAEGRFAETWTLPDGGTYRIAGRPYPNGAIAFVLEDISDEIGMSRRMREFMTRAQSALDTFDEAVAVFSPDGRLALDNAAHRTLWGYPAAEEPPSVLEATRHWQSLTRPTPVWGEFRDFVSDFGSRAEWSAEVRMSDGRPLTCRFAPLGDGSTLAAFRPPA